MATYPRLLSPLALPYEHAAVLRHPDQYDTLHRKNDFLAEDVHTVFGIRNGEAELQAFYFDAGWFTPAQAKAWLLERRLEPILFLEAEENRFVSKKQFGRAGQ